MKMKKNGPVSVPRPSKSRRLLGSHTVVCTPRMPGGSRGQARGRRNAFFPRGTRVEGPARMPSGSITRLSRSGIRASRLARTYPRDAKPMLHFSCSTLPTPGSAAADARRRASWPHERTTVRRERHPERVVEKNDRFLSCVGAPRRTECGHGSGDLGRRFVAKSEVYAITRLIGRRSERVLSRFFDENVESLSRVTGTTD